MPLKAEATDCCLREGLYELIARTWDLGEE